MPTTTIAPFHVPQVASGPWCRRATGTGSFDEAVAVAQGQATAFVAKWQARYPAAVACVTDELALLAVHGWFRASTGPGSATAT